MKILLIVLSLLSTLSAFNVEVASTHVRVVPKGQNLNKIISWYGILDNAIDAVVNIKIHKNGKPIGVGSGVIISKSGYIVTNAHVVGKADEIYVFLNEKPHKIKAKIVGMDKPNDLAVIKIKSQNLNVIEFADSDKIQLTDLVFAVGNGIGLGKTVSQGIISALNKNIGLNEYENFIQTDAIINPGNSGGALVNNQGELIGVNTAKIVRRGISGIGFAIPSNTTKSIVKAIIENGKFERGYFGASFEQKDDGKVEIDSIDTNSEAYKAGIRIGDIIISIDDNMIYTVGDVINCIGLKQSKENVRIKYSHNGVVRYKTVMLGFREPVK